MVVAVFMALIALGFLALAVDTGSLFSEKRAAQAAADAAAIAAAEEASTNPGNEQSVANAVAKLNGFDTTLATNPATVNLVTVSSWNSVNATYVQATISKPMQTFFLHAFSPSRATMMVSATATAGGAQASQTCVCLLGTSGETLNMSNNSKLTASSCGVVDNSSSSNDIGIVGSAALTALSVAGVASSWDNSSNINNGGSVSSSHIIQGLTSTCTAPTVAVPSYSSCLADPGGSYGTYTWGPSSASSVVCYTALTIGANGSTTTLNPGIYVITTGELHFESGSGGYSNLGGNGVFFYLTGTASLVIDNGANVNLVAGGNTEAGGGTAPTVGTYNGVAVYQASSDTAAMSIQGGSTAYINGSLYAPSAVMNLGNGSGSTIDSGIVASSLVMNGGGTLNITSAPSQGSVTFGSPTLVQ